MYYFIVNPDSQSGRGEKIWKKLERHLEHQNTEFKVYLTGGPGDARRFAAELTEGVREPRIIVAVGGDGTVNEVLDGLAFFGQITFGYIPAGSGNDLARSLKLPLNPKKCLNRILKPRYHRLLDYGVVTYGEERVEHRRFLISSGIGFDAAVFHRMLHSRMRRKFDRMRIGRAYYLLAGIGQICFSRPVKGYLLLDGVKKVEFNHIYFISCHILPYEGGGFKLAPKADGSDGRLELCVVHSSSKGRVVSALSHAMWGTHTRDRGVRFYECREVSIHVDRPMPVHVDGESCYCQRDIQLQCIERKLRMIV